jgi:hypothetical protein
MADDISREIDEILAEELPDNPQDGAENVYEAHRQELVRLLQVAADQLGESPSVNGFDSLDLPVSSDEVRNAFDSWNEAKREAGLETYDVGGSKGALIDERYFESIETEESAYWLGTLFSTSSIQRAQTGNGYLLSLGRVASKSYFITAFCEAVDSEYSVTRYQNSQSGNEQLQVAISNRSFVESLLELGLPAPDGEPGGFPSLDEELAAPFVRGYVEAGRKFPGDPWRIRTATHEGATTLQHWLEALGAKRATLTERKTDGVGVNVSSVFDIRTLYESIWPHGPDTAPSFKPYPEAILDYLEEEYPYPENLSYLSG